MLTYRRGCGNSEQPAFLVACDAQRQNNTNPAVEWMTGVVFAVDKSCSMFPVPHIPFVCHHLARGVEMDNGAVECY